MHTKGSRSLEYCKYQQIPTMLHDVVVRLFVIPHTRPRSERESERQRARNGASESVRVFPWASNNTYQRSKRNIERHMIFFHLVLWKNHADVYPIILPFIWLLGYRHKGCFQLQGSSRTLVGHQLLCADSINYALCTIIMGIFFDCMECIHAKLIMPLHNCCDVTLVKFLWVCHIVSCFYAASVYRYHRNMTRSSAVVERRAMLLIVTLNISLSHLRSIMAWP